jgi:hypothetical protein
MDLLKKLGMRKQMEREFALVPRLNRMGLSKTYIGSKYLPKGRCNERKLDSSKSL